MQAEDTHVVHSDMASSALIFFAVVVRYLRGFFFFFAPFFWRLGFIAILVEES
jgi:hypothetical protein